MIYAYLLLYHLIAPMHKNTERNTFRLVWFSTRSMHSKCVRKYTFSYQSKYLYNVLTLFLIKMLQYLIITNLFSTMSTPTFNACCQYFQCRCSQIYFCLSIVLPHVNCFIERIIMFIT